MHPPRAGHDSWTAKPEDEMRKAEPMSSNPDTGVTGTHGSRAARFFFMYLSTPAVIVLYFILCGEAPYSAAGGP
jgi:hypothetical protein